MWQPALESLAPATITVRTQELFDESQRAIHRRADRLFAHLMVWQWVAGVVAALWISPQTWIGAASQTHWHVWAAVLLGGTLTGFPVFLAWKMPGQVLTRHVIAVAQMLMSALLIHLTGGRIETHFHVFGSLAFFAFYRDWRVLLTATVVVALDHAVRGIFWPQSVFGVLASSNWRWVEHAAWVVFEDTFLFISIRQSLCDMHEVAERRAGLEAVNASIERQVRDRTAELEKAHRELLETSRRAGMAEVATGVLHNVGNVLNSVNVSVTLLEDGVKKLKGPNLARAVALLRDHSADLGTFLTLDPKGRQIPPYLTQVAEHLTEEQAALLKELVHLQKSVEHIKEIVSLQQSHARANGVCEPVQVADLVEHALRMHDGGLVRHHVKVVREFGEVPTVLLEKHKVLQILINLISNAKYACITSSQADKCLTLRVSQADGRVRIAVLDNGVGIAPENLTRIFSHGFTTKKDGHGFGLHSGALAARELGGSLTVRSDGPGLGASFTLELPLEPPSGKDACTPPA